MFICPICSKEFDTEENIRGHFLTCWKEHHSVHKSKSAPHSESTTRQTNVSIVDFFKRINNERCFS